MKIVNMATKDLIPYELNAKFHDDVQVANVANSIKRFGWQQPIVIDENNVVIIGHCRLLAAKKLGLKEVPVTVATGLSEQEVRELRIADNKSNESQWIWDLLERDRQGLEFEGFQFDWTHEGVEEELPHEPEAVEDNFDPDEDVPEESDIRPGDIFLCGDHRVMCGDSTNADDVLTLMGGTKADLFLTDPPYNINYEEKQKNLAVFRDNKRVANNGNIEIENDFTDDASYIQFLHDVFSNADLVMRLGAAFYIWHAIIHVEKVIEAIKRTGWKHKQQLVWVKNNFSLTRMDYQYKHEVCWYGWKNGKHYFTERRNELTVIDDKINPKKLKKEEMLELLEKLLSDMVPTTVLYEDKPLMNDIHPTMKPIKLMARLVVNSSLPGWNVLDLFGGSGSTMMACEQLGRKCYTMETSPVYCEAMLNRWARFTGGQVYRLQGGQKVPYDVGL